MKFYLQLTLLLSLIHYSGFSQNDWKDTFIKNTTSDLEYNNYKTATNLQNQGIRIAESYAAQIEKYSSLGYAANPQQLLNNFNNNMQKIADLQSQNKADNLQQLDNTLSTTINQINSGNGEGALLSGLSYIDQRAAQKEAQRRAEYQRQSLILEQQNKMSKFYWKAVELNNQAIESYYQNAAYSFYKTDEKYNLEYVKHHGCFADFMAANYQYNSIAWTRNNCPKPALKAVMENKLLPKDIQLINAAKRKQQLFVTTKNPIFQEGAMKFAGSAANEKPSAEYFYLMGHYASTENALVAYSAFLSAKKYDKNYFTGDKLTEFENIKNVLSDEFKQAIDDSNLDELKKAIDARIHEIIRIDNKIALLYAISSDKPDAVQLFLNDFAEGASQEDINNKVHKSIMMAAISDAPLTIQRFIDLGYSIDFTLQNYTPFDIALKSNSEQAMIVIAKNSNNSDNYQNKIIEHSKKKSDINTLNNLRSTSTSSTQQQEITNIISDFDEKAYNKSINENTRTSYLNYLTEFPNGNHANEVKTKIVAIDELNDYKTAKTQNSTNGYRSFLNKYTTSSHKKEIQLFLFDKLYEEGSYKEALLLKDIVQDQRGNEIRKAKSNIAQNTSMIAVHIVLDNNWNFGFGNVTLKSKGLGWYWLPSANFASMFYDDDIEINEEGKLVWSNELLDGAPLQISKVEKVKSVMPFGVSIGATHKIGGPLWISGGLGFGKYCQRDQVTYRENRSYSNELLTEDAVNKVESGIFLYLETGIYLKITKGFLIKTTLLSSSKIKAIQFGATFSLFDY